MNRYTSFIKLHVEIMEIQNGMFINIHSRLCGVIGLLQRNIVYRLTLFSIVEPETMRNQMHKYE
jgi:hypothetical protein